MRVCGNAVLVFAVVGVVALSWSVARAADRSLLFPDGFLTVPADGSGLAPTLGDLTGDGLPDLLHVPQGGDQIWLVPSTGRWAWGEPFVAATLPGLPFYDAVVLDMNTDGVRDVVFLRGTEGDDPVSVQVVLSNGAGGFEARPAVEFAATLRDTLARDRLAVGDVDGDGLPDVAATPSELVVYRGLGGGDLDAAEVLAQDGLAVEIADVDDEQGAEDRLDVE